MFDVAGFALQTEFLFPFGGLLCGIIIASLIIWIIIGVWVYRDAESRGMSGALWLIIVILLGLIGIIIYLIVRGGHPVRQPGQYYPPGAPGTYPPPGYVQPPAYGAPPPGSYAPPPAAPAAPPTWAAPATCKNCGAPLAAGATFCAACGTKV